VDFVQRLLDTNPVEFQFRNPPFQHRAGGRELLPGSIVDGRRCEFGSGQFDRDNDRDQEQEREGNVAVHG
jgi:hypothetical protein